MYTNKPYLKKLESFSTSEGMLVPVYKDWEEWHESYQVKMVYFTTLSPSTVKGPILHMKRRGMMSCISGDVTIECLVDDQVLKFDLMNNNERYALVIPAGIPNRIINNSSEYSATILNLPDRAWHPDDEDTIKFGSWEECTREQLGV